MSVLALTNGDDHPEAAQKRGTQGHNLAYLSSQIAAFASVAGARTARYFKTATTGVPQGAIASWTPGMRYRPATMTLTDAHAWYAVADAVFQETIAQMRLDGVL